MRPSLLLALSLTAALVLGACASETVAVDGPGVRVASAQDVATVLAADPAPVLIDVRTPAEFAEGHIEGATLIDYNASDFRDRVAELDPDATYVIYCRSGNRSAGARAVLEDLGFVDVTDIEGGILAWNAAGLPVVTG